MCLGAAWESNGLCLMKIEETQFELPIHDLELTTVVFAVKTWRHYLYGATWQISMDHKQFEISIHILGTELNARNMDRVNQGL